MAYSKLHSSVVASSLWTQPDSVRILFITLLALCDQDGVVYGSKRGLTRMAMIDPTEEDAAWECLLSPDNESSDAERSPENEGRRIEKVSGGYRLLNFSYYRGLRNDDERREQNRVAQAKFRENTKKVSQGKPESAKVSQSKPLKAQAEAEAEAEAEALLPTEEGGNDFLLSPEKPKRKDKSRGTLEEFRTFAVEIGLRASDGEAKFHGFEANGWKIGKGAVKDWKATMRNWKENGYHPSQKNGATEPEPAPKSEYYPPRQQETIAEMIIRLDQEHEAKMEAEKTYYDDDTR